MVAIKLNIHFWYVDVVQSPLSIWKSDYNSDLLLRIKYTTKHPSCMILLKEKEAVNDQNKHFYATGIYYFYVNIQ